jgi:hypothetical protein
MVVLAVACGGAGLTSLQVLSIQVKADQAKKDLEESTTKINNLRQPYIPHLKRCKTLSRI